MVACEKRACSRWGYNADVVRRRPQAPDRPFWNWGVYMTYAVQKGDRRHLDPENSLMGLAEGICDLAPLTANCAEGTQKPLRRPREDSGRLA